MYKKSTKTSQYNGEGRVSTSCISMAKSTLRGYDDDGDNNGDDDGDNNGDDDGDVNDDDNDNNNDDDNDNNNDDDDMQESTKYNQCWPKTKPPKITGGRIVKENAGEEERGENQLRSLNSHDASLLVNVMSS